MSQDAIHKFIATVALHFPRPKFNDDDMMETAWLASMNRVLSHYPNEVLADAAVRIIAKRNPKKDGRFFPVPSECVEFCEEAAEVRRLQATPLLTTANRDPSPFASWRASLAEDILKAPMGQRAAQEGWGQALYEFVRDKGRAPLDEEIRQVKSGAQSLDEGVEICRRGEGGFCNKALLKLGEGMLARRKELEARVLGEKAA